MSFPTSGLVSFCRPCLVFVRHAQVVEGSGVGSGCIHFYYAIIVLFNFVLRHCMHVVHVMPLYACCTRAGEHVCV